MDVLQQAKEWKIDLPTLMKILARSNDVRDAGELLSLINTDVAELLTHKAMICGYHVMSSGCTFAQHFLQHNFPSGYANAVASAEGRADSPLMQRWRATH